MFFDRAIQKTTRAIQIARAYLFKAPYRGWIRNESLADSKPGGAEVMDNWFPTPEGCRIRRGSDKQATIDAAVTHITSYVSGATEKLFAADATSIYDVTSPADVDVAPTADVTGQTGGDYSSLQFTTAGGSYLVMVNGVDDMQQYDGQSFYPVSTDEVVQLPFDAQTGAFTKGLTVTGGTSTATGVIVGIYDAGTTGTLYLNSVSGTFQNDETITDTSTGSATSNIPSGTDPGRAITGVDTDTLIHVWRYSSRLWFIGEGMSAWYLGSLAVSGTATEFPLQGVFELGGSLMFGTSWSHDAGDGMDDYCAFVTTEGEVAIYQGDPSSTMSKVGVYRIGRPLHKNAHFRAGGDVGVLTDDGIASIRLAVEKDRAGGLGNAVTYPIEEAWRLAIRERFSGLNQFTCVIWPSKTMLVVGIPASGSQKKIAYVANTSNGAWCRYVGWDIRALHVFDDKLYFGTRDGYIVEGEVTGSDQGEPYSAVVIPKFADFNSAAEKMAVSARIQARANNPFTPQLFANSDYETEIPTPLAADSDENANAWGSGVWGTSTWGGAFDSKARHSEWQGVAAVGQTLAPGLQVTTGRTTAPDVELVAIHLVYEEGGLMG